MTFTSCFIRLPNNASVSYNCSLDDDPEAFQSFYSDLISKMNLTVDSPTYPENDITIYGAPIVLLLGTVGNFLSILTLFHFMREKAIYMYLFALGIVNLLVLYIGLFEHWLSLAMPYGLDKSGISCKAWAFFYHAFIFTSAWLIVGVTFERYLPLCHGPKLGRQRRFYRKRSFSVIFLIFFFAIAYSLHFIWTVEVDRTTFTQCIYTQKHVHFTTKILPWIDKTIVWLVPVILILTLNAVGRCRILKTEQANQIELKELKNENDGNELTEFINSTPDAQNESKTMYHHITNSTSMLTSMLTAISLSFFLTYLPFLCMLIIVNSTTYTSESILNTHLIIWHITSLLRYLSHYISFYLYCICSKDFREELVLIRRYYISKLAALWQQRCMGATVTNTNLAV